MRNTLYPVHCVETLVQGEDGGDQKTPYCKDTAQSTLATTSVAEAVKKAVGDKKSSTTDGQKLIANPNITDYKSQEEEIKAFSE